MFRWKSARHADNLCFTKSLQFCVQMTWDVNPEPALSRKLIRRIRNLEPPWKKRGFYNWITGIGHNYSTVKWGNSVTFFVQNRIFLRILLKWPTYCSMCLHGQFWLLPTSRPLFYEKLLGLYCLSLVGGSGQPGCGILQNPALSGRQAVRHLPEVRPAVLPVAPHSQQYATTIPSPSVSLLSVC